MKKILCLSLCVILIAGSLTACSGDEIDAYDLYTKMVAVMADVQSIDMDFAMLSDVHVYGELEESSTSGSIFGNIRRIANSETGEIEAALKINTNISSANTELDDYITSVSDSSFAKTNELRFGYHYAAY